MSNQQQGEAQAQPALALALRTVSKPRPITREEAKLEWKKGNLVGMFNLPSEEVFNACTDFCVEASTPDPEILKLKEALKKMTEQNLVQGKELLEAKETRAQVAAQALFDEGRAKALLDKVTAEKDSLAKELRILRKDRAERDKLRQSDAGEIERLRKALSDEKSKYGDLHKELSQFDELKQKRKDKHQEELRQERASYAQLAHEHRELETKFKQLFMENEQLRASTVQLTTTDYMNRKALLQYLNSLNTGIGGPLFNNAAAHAATLYPEDKGPEEEDDDDNEDWKV